MKKYLITLICLGSLFVSAFAQTLTEAEKEYQQDNFIAAQKIYEQLIKTAHGADLYHAQLRSAMCEFSKGAFLNAAVQLYNYPLPKDPIWQARFLLYRIRMAKQVSGVYRQVLNSTPIDSPDAKKDKTQWTRAQWQTQIDSDFRQLWTLRSELLQAPIEQENLFFNIKDTDTQRIPTLFDFTVQTWKDYLENNCTLAVAPLSSEIPSFLNGNARLKEGQTKPTALLIAQLQREAALAEGHNRQNARLFWQVDTIKQPFYGHDFIIENKTRAEQTAIEQLRVLTGLETEKTTWWQRLKNTFTPPTQAAYARSYAALELVILLSGQNQFAQALDVCKYAQEKLAPSFYTQQCAERASLITQVELNLRADGQMINRQKPTLTFTGKNLKRVYARVYPTSFEELSQLHSTHYNRRTINSWSEVTYLNSEDVPTFLARTPQHLQSVAVPYEEVGKYQQGTLSLPTLEPGFYVVLLSRQDTFDPKKAPVSGWVINATDLALFATAAIDGNPADYTATRTAADKTLTPNVFHIYSVNLQSGEIEPNVPLKLITNWNGARETARTQADAVADLPRAVTVSGRERNNGTDYRLDVLATKESSTAFTGLNFRFYNEAPVKLFPQSDRPIYRPGQTAHLAVEALERLPRGWKTLGNTDVQFKVTDPNGKQIFSAKVPTDALGSAQTKFTLPENDLLGSYGLNVSLTTNGRSYHAYHSLRVEEYKRPDYEVVLDAVQKPLQYNQQATLSGSAKYYMGTPLAKAKVSYTLRRRNYIPPFYWWWWTRDPLFYAHEDIVAQGNTQTNEQGVFNVTFTPTRLEEDEEFARYELEANVYDESGRTISATRTYKISAHPHLFRVEFAQGFYDANKPTALADIELTDADGNNTTGKVAVTIQALENKQPVPTSNTLPCMACNEQNSLETLYEDIPAIHTAFNQTLVFSEPQKQTLQLPALPEGVYRLKLSSEKAAPQQMIFIVAAEKSALKLPDVALSQRTTYYPGETMRVLVGAGDLKGTKRLEIYQEGNFLLHRALLKGGVEVFSFPIKQTHRGGIALRWFGASDYRFHGKQTSAEIPFDNKKLSVKLDTPKTVQPGEDVVWKITLKDATGSAVNGLVNATVYDKSLDYYAKNTLPLKFNQLYAQNKGTAHSTSSQQGSPTVWYSKEDHKTTETVGSARLLPLPSLNIEMPSYRGLSKGLLRSEGSRRLMANAKAASFAVEESVALNDEYRSGKEVPLAAQDALGENAEPNTPVTVRSDFSETAYFNASVPVTGGKGTLAFTLPQTLTTWNILGFALTPKADMGTFDASVIAQKDLMLRLQLPRFYREGDRGIIQAALTNKTDKKITAQVALSLGNKGANALSDFGITEPEKTVTIPANTTQFVSWEMVAPNIPALYQVTAVVRAGKLNDGEQKTLPVLPGKMRLVASAHTALQNGTNTLSLPELSNVPPADVELTALTLNPSLALSVINSMPNLLASPYKDLVSSLNRYVPLAVVHQFYTTYPQLKEAVKKLPKRAGRTATWNENDPLRLQLLEQTPWLRQAQGRVERQADIINLFDDKIVSAQLEKELKNITKLQNASGAFTWFAGGPDDDYLTLYALSQFAQALAYQAPIAKDPVKKAVAYITPKIDKRLKQDQSGSVSAVSYALYAAYTLSSFPAHWEQTAKARPSIKRWIDFADAQRKFMTPLGQIYAAAVYHRLGDDIKANEYLDLVLSRIKQDPLAGAYFAPEAQSWIWYNDTLSTQTTTLRTLVEMRPQSPFIAPMLQWLLFNRQVNDWTDTKATTQAVFTILSVMQAQGALAKPSTYTLRWSDETKHISFDPLDFTEDLQFVRTGTQVTPESYHAEIDKQSPQTDFASLNAVYRAHDVTASPDGVINVSRAYFRREKSGTEVSLHPLTDLASVQVGDEIEVHLTLTTHSAFEYVLLQDPKPAGFESDDLLSGWTHQTIGFYREVKDAATNFFINWVPSGTVTLRYTLRPTVDGKLHALPAQVQSMYAPEYAAHSASETFHVEK